MTFSSKSPQAVPIRSLIDLSRPSGVARAASDFARTAVNDILIGHLALVGVCDPLPRQVVGSGDPDGGRYADAVVSLVRADQHRRNQADMSQPYHLGDGMDACPR